MPTNTVVPEAMRAGLVFAPDPGVSTCRLTVLRSRGPRLAKTLEADGTIRAYGDARTFDLAAIPAACLGDLAAVLHQLLERPDLCVVRGAITDPGRVRSVRRLLHRCPQTGDEPTLREVPRHWVALDIDELPAPEGLDPRDLAGCAAAVRDVLPAPFHEAALLVQASASHTIKPGLQLRVWAWLSRPITGGEGKQWLRGSIGLDLSTLNAAQVIYTAAPILAAGVADPMPAGRLHLSTGHPVVEVPRFTRSPLATRVQVPAATSGVGRGYGAKALARAAARIASAPIKERHATAVAEAWSLARLVAGGAVTTSEVERVINGALQMAGKPDGEGTLIAKWACAQRAGGAA
ncbi:MAG: hypothetical protein WCP77_07800 [Roseococcus sp.]